MSYRYFVTKRAPMAAWILDDTVPFQECTGSNASGGKKSGSGDPAKSAPLVAGAAWSSVFKTSAVGQFACPLFKQGLETRPFALETWLYPIHKSEGQESQASVTNLITNPSFETNTTGWGFNTVGGSFTETRESTGGYVGTYFRRNTATVASTGANVGPYFFMGAGTVAPGETVSAKAYLRSNAALNLRCIIEWKTSSGSANGSSSGTAATLTVGQWKEFSHSAVAPAGTDRATFTWYTTTTVAVGNQIDIDAAIAVKSATLPPYFDGATPGYEWTGTAHGSTSRTRSDISRVNNALNPAARSGGSASEFLSRWSWTGAFATGTGPTEYLNTFRRETSPGTEQTNVGSRGIDLYTNLDIAPGTSGNAILHPVVQGETITFSAWVRWSVTLTPTIALRFHRGDGTWVDNAVAASSTSLTANTWRRISVTTTVPAEAKYLGGYLRHGSNVTFPANSTFDITGIVIERSSTMNDTFDGSSPGAIWSGTANSSPSYLLISNNEQRVLSHDNVFDGLTIDGKVLKFSTQYLTTGEAACDYDLQTIRAAHVVAIHNSDQNQLWVNGELVSSVDITDEQKADSYIAAATGDLFSGYTTSSQEVAMNGVAFYPSITGDQINQNYLAGIDAIPQAVIAPQHDGTPFSLNSANGTIFLEESWVNQDDFSTGLKDDVEFASDQINPAYVAGLSVAGSWTVGVPLDSQADTSIYGVMVEWSGKDIDVDVSLDGTSWTQAYNGELVSIISDGYNPTDKDLQIRVSFAGGLAEDPAYLESLSVVGFRNNTLENLSARTVTVSHPAVLRRDYEPILYRDDNGVSLNGGTLTIGTDTTADPDVARTLELWIKPLSGVPTISVGGTKYRNGIADSTLPVGEWSLIHYVAAADITSSITVTGDCIVGQAVLYPTALIASEVTFIFESYAGHPYFRINDTQDIEITEPATPVTVYTHDWAIDSAG